MATPTILDLGTIDIGTGGTTAAQMLCWQRAWSIAPTVTGTAGNAKYTVQVSQDNVSWFDYKTLGTNVDIVDAVEDNNINWSWLRIVVSSGGPSSGTAQFGMELKAN